MRASEAVRHESSQEHVLNVRRVEEAMSRSNTTDEEPSSPEQMASSDPPEIFSDSSPERPRTLAGPALPGDPEDAIYDDFTAAWRTPSSHPPAPDPNSDPFLDEALAMPSEELAREHADGDTEYSIPQNRLDSEPDSCAWDDNEPPDQTTVDEILPDAASRFYPWDSKEKCVTSLLTAFPRSVFSTSELSAMRWASMNCGATQVPTVDQIKYSREKISRLCGASASTRVGAMGNTFTVLDLSTIIAHEWANPLVRRHVATLAEDAGSGLDRRSQAGKWRNEVDPMLGGPMARHNGKDYYVEEPALARLDGAEGVHPVLPMRWFTRSGATWAQVWPLRKHPTKDAFLVDARAPALSEVPLTAFVLSYPELASTHEALGYPNPGLINGVVYTGRTWTNRDIAISEAAIRAPNPLREIARSRQVLSVPLSFYCDDTSGNVSKKWNKHNSILFTLSGLSPEHAHLLYNIHFLATSNIAPPLEMFEAVVEMIREIRHAGGIPAYDSVLEEEVLLMPWVHDFDADNPMASEFSCHIGLSGKCMCRLCTAEAPKESDDIEEEKKRLGNLLKIAPLRSKADLRDALNAQLNEALRGAPSNMSTLATETGVKDRYFQFFADQLSDACARLKAMQQKDPRLKGSEFLIRELRRIRAEMPDDIFSPVLRLEEFDPTRDTPVEILHVVLLGFVKYFWRDAVSRQSDYSKEILVGRINSFDTASLGASQACGNTLVYYAGSLTGRDFRLVLQMAPSILPGLVPDVVYDAWLALCHLCPLLFQPTISNIDAYLLRLQEAIDDFLATTALWNTQWFNKPKFHILLHAPAHIARLGPAPLASTEGYESFNHVIRCRSVHSPRHAPSKDIAEAFSWLHAVRHLLSGGFIFDPQHPQHWRKAGEGVLAFTSDNLLARFMGMTQVLCSSQAGLFKIDPAALPVSRSDVLNYCSTQRLLANDIRSPALLSCLHVVLKNEDIVTPHAFVLTHGTTCIVDSAGATTQIITPRVCKVVSIFCSHSRKEVIGFVVQPYQIGDYEAPYNLPGIRPLGNACLWLPLEHCVARVSVFHNCKRNHCIATKTRPVVHERRATQKFEWEVKHNQNPNDLVMNLAQLRSAVSLQEFQAAERRPGLDRATLLDRAVHHRRRIVEEGEAAVLTTTEPALELSMPAATFRKKRARRNSEASASGS
ncbi:hypothetical protein GGF50DRAFT_21913, partial [Schizophyllum commune]